MKIKLSQIERARWDTSNRDNIDQNGQDMDEFKKIKTYCHKMDPILDPFAFMSFEGKLKIKWNLMKKNNHGSKVLVDKRIKLRQYYQKKLRYE